MKLFKIGKKNFIHYLPYHEITEKKYQKAQDEGTTMTYEYFIKGKGWKKTKSWEIIEDNKIPELWESSWYEVCQIVEKYGWTLGVEYADKCTAGIIAEMTLRGKFAMYLAAKPQWEEAFKKDPKLADLFFNTVKCNYKMSTYGYFTFDITGLDETLSKVKEYEYNGADCTYKGKEKVSLYQFISEEFGKEYSEIVTKLINSDLNNLFCTNEIIVKHGQSK